MAITPEPARAADAANEALVALQQTLYASRNPTRRWLHCTRRDWIAAALRRNAPPGGEATAIEIGPGCGVHLPVLAERFREVVALDVEPAYLESLAPLRAQHANLRVAIDDITHSTWPTESADLVLCTEVIEHIAASPAALAHMHRILRPGGSLVLSTPHRYCPLEVLGRIAFLPGVISIVRLIYREPVLPTGHINLFTASRLRAEVEAAGFEIRERHSSGLYLPLLAEFGGEAGKRSAQRIEERLRGGPLDWLLWTQYLVAVKPAGASALPDRTPMQSPHEVMDA